MFQAPRGTQDILPAEQPYWRYIQKAAEGYRRTLRLRAHRQRPFSRKPGFFVRTVGEGTDIVEKEMYTFEDHGGGQITLRPEGTAPVCRAYIENGHGEPAPAGQALLSGSHIQVREAPGGTLPPAPPVRFEAIGDGDASLDAEMIDMVWRFFQTLGLKKLTLQINSIGCPNCRPAYLAKLKEYYAGHKEELCGDCKVRLEKNTLRLLDCKKPTLPAVRADAPRSIDNLCPECAAHFEQLKRNLTTLKLPFEINSSMVRDWDYYTKTVFEIQPEEERGQSTVAGGGRYDGLLEELGARPTPAVGFATGIERIILNLKKQNGTCRGWISPRFSWCGWVNRPGTRRSK
jgi:histidyl-tRNA synthetase